MKENISVCKAKYTIGGGSGLETFQINPIYLLPHLILFSISITEYLT